MKGFIHITTETINPEHIVVISNTGGLVSVHLVNGKSYTYTEKAWLRAVNEYEVKCNEAK